MHEGNKSVASSLIGKLEKSKGDIYGVVQQHSFKFQMSNLTAISDHCDSDTPLHGFEMQLCIYHLCDL